MIATKLTLTASKAIIADAKRLAADRHTSVSAIFGRFIAGLKQMDRSLPSEPPPLTRRASGLIKLPENIDDKTLTANALGDKYAL